MSSEFSVTPQSKNATLGDSVTLTCEIQSNPPSKITWLYNGNIPEFGEQTTSTALLSNFTLENVGYDMDGEYRCQALNPLTGEVKFSGIAHLTIQGELNFTLCL